jgi:MFS family permease
MFMPLSFLYFLMTTHLGTAAIGLGISLAAVAALPAGLVAGPLIDRVGAKPVMVLNNLLSACGYVGYLFAHDFGMLVATVFLVIVADRLFFASWPVLVADLSGPHGTDWLYSLVSKYRNASLAAGYLIGGGVLALLGHAAAAYVIVVLNCLSSLVAAMILSRLRTRRPEGKPPAGPPRTREAAGWRRSGVLRDRPYLVLTFAQSALAFAWLVPGTILPVYLVHVLALPRWTPSAVLCVNFLAVAVWQVKITGWAAKYRRTAIVGLAAVFLALAAGVFALAAHAPASAAVVVIVAGMASFSAGEMLWNPAASALAADAAPPAARGRYIAMFQMSWAVSNTAGPVLAGTLLSAGPGWLWGVLASLVALGGTGFLLAGHLLPASVNQPMARPVATP